MNIESKLTILSQDLMEVLKDREDEFPQKINIQIIVQRVISQFRQCLDVSQKGKEDFMHLTVEHWDDHVLDHMVDLVKVCYSTILADQEPLETKEKDLNDDVNKDPENLLGRQIEHYIEKRNALIRYHQCQVSRLRDDNSDTDSLHLEDES